LRNVVIRIEKYKKNIDNKIAIIWWC